MEKPAVFIVEDEAIVANDIKETLKSLGYTVPGIAKSGEIALEKIKETQPNLVLMDIHLAGKMDGIATAGMVKAQSDIPVIYLTAFADQELLERAKITEPYGYILKPYDERELHSVIKMALYKHTIDKEIKKRDAILFAVSSAVEWLLRVSRTKSEKPEKLHEFNASDIRNVLEQIGLAVDASSISIFDIQSDSSGSETINIKYEWAGPGSQSSLYKPELKQLTPSFLGISRWQNLLMKGELISATLSTLPEGEKRLFTLLGVKSGIVLPIFIRDTMWGFIGFFDLSERIRSSDEVEALRITANLLGAAMGYG